MSDLELPKQAFGHKRVSCGIRPAVMDFSPLLWSHRLEIAFLIRIPLPQNDRGGECLSRLVEGEEEVLTPV